MRVSNTRAETKGRQSECKVRGIPVCKISKKIMRVIIFIVTINKKYLLIQMSYFWIKTI